MRLYNGKSIRYQVDQRVSRQSETRDAILWEIDSVKQVARVKIQGSNNLVTAHFPRNWKTTPYWCKTGNAVSVRHRNGVRGYVELIGEGRAIPSPVAGGTAMPSSPGLADMVLTGCELFATDPASMNLLATGGTYRINGQVYVFDPQELTVGAVVMDDPAPMTMGSGTVMMMGTSFYTVVLDPAPAAGYFRYDLCYVGIDGVLHYVAGTPAANNPVKPTLPAETVQIGKYILVKGGATAIENADIGAVWSERVVTSMTLSYDTTHEWSVSDPETTRTIQVAIKDQYGSAIKISGTLKLEKMYGSGTIYSSDTGWSGSIVTQTLAASTGYTFTYKRNQNTTEHSPTFKITLQIATALIATAHIDLLDVNGDPIY